MGREYRREDSLADIQKNMETYLRESPKDVILLRPFQNILTLDVDNEEQRRSFLNAWRPEGGSMCFRTKNIYIPIEKIGETLSQSWKGWHIYLSVGYKYVSADPNWYLLRSLIQCHFGSDSQRERMCHDRQMLGDVNAYRMAERMGQIGISEGVVYVGHHAVGTVIGQGEGVVNTSVWSEPRNSIAIEPNSGGVKFKPTLSYKPLLTRKS